MTKLRSARILPLVFSAVLGLGTLVACSGDTPGEVAPGLDVVVLSLEGDIGPEGGTLQGAAGTVLFGVRLEVPPGALSSRTHLRIVPALDPTPLPEESVRVGSQFTLEGSVSFAAPVNLTLPVDREFSAVSSKDGGAALKVWMRTEDGSFRLIEPIATTSSTVTVATSRIDVAAAGIKLHPTPTHPGCGPVGCVDLVSCTEADGMCATDPIDLPFTTFGGGSIGMFRPTAYPARDGGEQIVFHGSANGSIGRLSLPGNQASFSTVLLPSSAFLGETGISDGFTLAHRLVDGPAGDANTAVFGRFAIPLSGPASPPATGTAATPFASSPSRAAITLGDGRTVVFLGGPLSIPSFVIRAPNGQVSPTMGLAGPPRSLVAAAPDRSRPDAFWLFSHSVGQPRIELVDAAGNVIVAPTLPPAIANRLLAEFSGSNGSPLAATTGLVTTTEGALLGLVDRVGSTNEPASLLLVRPDGSLALRAPLSDSAGAIFEIDADREGHVWMRVALPDGSTGLLFMAKGGSVAPKFVPLDRSLHIHEVFPSADKGVWVEVRALTGANRPLRLVKIRPGRSPQS